MVLLRRALYELQRDPKMSRRGPTEPELLNYMASRGWPSIINDFDQAMQRLIQLGKAEPDAANTARANARYRLTHHGLIEEDQFGPSGRRPLLPKFWAALREPERIASAILAAAAALIGYLFGAGRQP